MQPKCFILAFSELLLSQIDVNNHKTIMKSSRKGPYFSGWVCYSKQTVTLGSRTTSKERDHKDPYCLTFSCPRGNSLPSVLPLFKVNNFL